MTDKWEYRREIQNSDNLENWEFEIFSDKWNIAYILDCPENEKVAQQICHEHNTYGILIEALEKINKITAYNMPDEAVNEVIMMCENALNQANNKE